MEARAVTAELPARAEEVTRLVVNRSRAIRVVHLQVIRGAGFTNLEL